MLHNQEGFLQESPTANHTTASKPSQNWLVDFVASHHVTSNLNAFSLHQPYEETNNIVIGDDLSLNITYISKSLLSTPLKSFSLSNVLCVPNMQKKNNLCLSILQV